MDARRMTATAKPVKIILQSDGNLLLQARVAEMALAAGRPEGKHGNWRVYEIDPSGQEFVAYYNKASITIHPQPSADATAKHRDARLGRAG
jgi:hypothetical protein